MIKYKKIIVFSLLCVCVFFLIDVYAKEVPFTLEDRDRLIRLEVKLEEIDKRFEQIMSFMWILAVVFGGITVSTIGFAIWDRRTMIRPFETKVKGIEIG
ncbi:MAG: hypothetical protein QME40_00235 [bacterium]|nr:hypothetical protein [bacterium]